MQYEITLSFDEEQYLINHNSIFQKVFIFKS